MKELLKKNITLLMGVFLFIFMMLINGMNEGSPGGADSYIHHMISKWSFIHPELFFDHWGKPLFTLVSSPFAQFGLKGSATINIILAIASGLLVRKMAHYFGVKNAWLGVLMVVFSPMFFAVSLSSLTEILFAFVLILAIYFFSRNQIAFSLITISFIPFARTEGIIFIPLFFGAVLWIREFKKIPFLLTGFVVMAVMGYAAHDDVLWPITEMPYSVSSNSYGHGDLFHFINHSSAIFGWPLLISFLLGLYVLLGQIRKRSNLHFTLVIFLVVSSVLTYFFAHSVVWAFGMGSSAGLTRVMAGITPLVGCIGLFGVSGLVERFIKVKRFRAYLMVLLGLVFVLEGLTKRSYPILLGQEERVVQNVCEYLSTPKNQDAFIVYYHPYVPFFLALDPFSGETCKERVFDVENPGAGLDIGSVIIWDAHFSPNEGGLTKEVLLNDTNLILIKEFKPIEYFTTYGNRAFEVLLFQKI
ncbi:MAG: hypothetical protein ACI9GM_000294 [Salibacteraceae bacterium]|jgi:hypothetical protein